MKNYTIDDLYERTGNKYILAEVISQTARYLKKEQDISIGYEAINEAILDLMDGKISYQEEQKIGKD